MKMISQNLVISAVAEKKGVSKKIAKEILEGIDEIVEIVANTIELDQYAKVGSYIAVEKKLQLGRSGKNPKTKIMFNTADKVVINIKKTPKVKELN